MTITELLTALEASQHERYPLATDQDLKQTEGALGRPLPPSFRQFVTQFSNGAYVYGLQEVSAVGEGNDQIAAIQNVILPGRPTDDQQIPVREGGFPTPPKSLVALPAQVLVFHAFGSRVTGGSPDSSNFSGGDYFTIDNLTSSPHSLQVSGRWSDAQHDPTY
jgi:hypothetical protein